MQDGETPRKHKYGERKTAQIMMATVRHVTSSSGLRKILNHFRPMEFCSTECTALNDSQVFFNICWERKQLGRACFILVPVNVPYVFISESIQVLAS